MPRIVAGDDPVLPRVDNTCLTKIALINVCYCSYIVIFIFIVIAATLLNEMFSIEHDSEFEETRKTNLPMKHAKVFGA